MVNPLILDFLGAVVRFVLVYILAPLVTARVITEGQAAGYVAALTDPGNIAWALVSLTPLAWSLYQKYGNRLKLLAALVSPAGSTENHAEAIVKAGDAPSASTPKDVPPSTGATPQELREPQADPARKRPRS